QRRRLGGQYLQPRGQLGVPTRADRRPELHGTDGNGWPVRHRAPDEHPRFGGPGTGGVRTDHLIPAVRSVVPCRRRGPGPAAALRSIRARRPVTHHGLGGCRRSCGAVRHASSRPAAVAPPGAWSDVAHHRRRGGDIAEAAARSLTARSSLCEGCPRFMSAVAFLAEGQHLSFQRPTGALVRRSCAGWLVAFALGAAVAFAAGPTYELLGHEAPDFALHAVSGGNVRLSEHRGEVVVLSFWGSRCPPCREQLAALDKSLATYRSAGLQVYGINVDDDQSRALDFAHGETVSFALLLDPEKNVSRSYQ